MSVALLEPSGARWLLGTYRGELAPESRVRLLPAEAGLEAPTGVVDLASYSLDLIAGDVDSKRPSEPGCMNFDFQGHAAGVRLHPLVLVPCIEEAPARWPVHLFRAQYDSVCSASLCLRFFVELEVDYNPRRVIAYDCRGLAHGKELNLREQVSFPTRSGPWVGLSWWVSLVESASNDVGLPSWAKGEQPGSRNSG